MDCPRVVHFSGWRRFSSAWHVTTIYEIGPRPDSSPYPAPNPCIFRQDDLIPCESLIDNLYSDCRPLDPKIDIMVETAKILAKQWERIATQLDKIAGGSGV